MDLEAFACKGKWCLVRNMATAQAAARAEFLGYEKERLELQRDELNKRLAIEKAESEARLKREEEAERRREDREERFLALQEETLALLKLACNRVCVNSVEGEGTKSKTE